MSCSLGTVAFGALLALAGCKRENAEGAQPSPNPALPAAAAPSASTAPTPAAAPPASARAADAKPDLLETSAGPVRITPVYHGTLRLEFGGRVIYVDPHQVSALPESPKADLVLITDIHKDHYDPEALGKVQQPSTAIIAPPVVVEKEPRARAIKNGERATVSGIGIEAVPMYNLKRGPKPGALFHDKGRGNGYILTLGGRRVYLAGDTECTDEMRALQNIDVAFVPMNLPYTMPPEEAAECVKAFRPKIVYPYHYRGSDLAVFQAALTGVPGVEVRLRDWYGGA